MDKFVIRQKKNSLEAGAYIEKCDLPLPSSTPHIGSGDRYRCSQWQNKYNFSNVGKPLEMDNYRAQQSRQQSCKVGPIGRQF